MSAGIRLLKKLRSVWRRWIPGPDASFLNELRTVELMLLVNHFPDMPAKILDFGAGTGACARALTGLGFETQAIDVEASNYVSSQVVEVKVYDGTTIPFRNETFDGVYASNVLEHVSDLENILRELSRVTKKGGVAIMLMPSPSWRFWTSMTDLVRSWHLSSPHGVHSRSILHEFFVFRRAWWAPTLQLYGWALLTQGGGGIFYTGNSIFGGRLSWSARRVLSRFLGSACNVFVLKKTS